jgi:glycosyltransferase involved in cell wall biosynthesis
LICSAELKKVLFIVPYPKGEAPSQRFRFEQYLSILKENQVDYQIETFWSKEAWSILYKDGNKIKKTIAFIIGVLKRFLLLLKIRDVQLIFIHREALPIAPPIIEFLLAKALRKKIIYDFDDAIWLPNTSKQNKIVRWIKFHSKVSSICRWSWKVSCGNTYLAEYAKKYNHQVYINPTTIDTTYHKTARDNSHRQKICIGWTGTHSTNKYFESMELVLSALVRNFSVEILAISDQKPNVSFDNFTFVKWNKLDEIKQLDHIDIGIMPLQNSIWELGKCGFKALQYMAMGIPAIASDVGVNNQIIAHGKNGFLCSNDEEWLQYLGELISSETLRKSIGEKGRKRAMDFYSVQSNSNLFLSLFE